MAGAEQEFSQTGKEHRLKAIVAPVVGEYDFIVSDTFPSLGGPTAAVEEVQANRTDDIFDCAGKPAAIDDCRTLIEKFLKGADA